MSGMAAAVAARRCTLMTWLVGENLYVSIPVLMFCPHVLTMEAHGLSMW